MSSIYSIIESEVSVSPDLSVDGLLHLPIDILALVTQHDKLMREYNILIGYLELKDLAISQEAMISRMLTARKMSIILAILIEKYIAHPEEAPRFKKDEALIREVLANDVQLIDPWLAIDNHEKNKPFSQKWRQEHPYWNWFRLIILRSKRLLHNLRPFLMNIKSYAATLDPIDKVANPILAQLSWIFFTPRLLFNLGFILNRCIPALGMPPEERDLPLSIRLKAALIARWFEIANDLVWMVNGILTCFLFIGGLTTVGIFITVGLYWYDVLLSCIRIHTELNHLCKLRKDMVMNNEPEELQKQLTAQLNFDKRRLAIGLVVNIGLAIAIMLTIPALMLMSPIYPLIGAAMLLAFTILSFVLTKVNDASKPKTHSGALLNHGLFKITPPRTDASNDVMEEPDPTLASPPESALYSALV